VITRLLISLFFLVGIQNACFANEQRGIGLSFGDPGGLTFFYRTTEKEFIQAYLGSGLVIGGDFNFSFAGKLWSQNSVIPYLGFGGFVFSGDSWAHSKDASGFGIRMPIGVILKVPDAPFHVHLEVAPATTISPFMHSFAAAMAGVRFLF